MYPYFFKKIVIFAENFSKITAQAIACTRFLPYNPFYKVEVYRPLWQW